MAINTRIYFPIIITFLTIIVILSLFTWSSSPDDDDEVIVLDDSLTDPLTPDMNDSQTDFLLIEAVGVNDQGSFIIPDQMTL